MRTHTPLTSPGLSLHWAIFDFTSCVSGSGISSYTNDPPKAGASLQACLDAAMMVIPRGRQQEAPAYLGATAGMRLLRYKGQGERSEHQWI